MLVQKTGFSITVLQSPIPQPLAFGPELIAAYRDAKAILSVRGMADRWEESNFINSLVVGEPFKTQAIEL
jgi:hypothetical protein